jgi:AraC-like DNA-binding protein
MKLYALFLLVFQVYGAPVYHEKNGEIVIEAEAWSAVEASGWRIANAYRDASAGAYIVSQGVFERRDRVSYDIYIQNPDTYYVFMRTWATDPGNNGVFLQLDGRDQDNEPRYTAGMYFYKTNRWDWRTKVGCGESCHEDTPFFIIRKPGKHVLTLRVKELDAVIDKIVIKTADVPPEDTGPRALPGSRKVPAPWMALFAVVLAGAVIWYVRKRRKPAPAQGTVKLSRHSDTMEKAKRFISENYTRDIGLPDLARETGLSENYIGKIFKDETGRSFVQTLNDFRIDRALDLMKTTPLSITEIHYKVGINHSSYFAKLFKERTGVAPSEEIKKYRK